MRAFFVFWVLWTVLLTPVGMAQETVPTGFVNAVDRRIATLQAEVNSLKAEPKVKQTPAAVLVVILFGAFCALWAQNTNRSAVLWFFLGMIFSVIAVIVLLIKNENDRERIRRQLVMERRVAER